MVVSSLAKTVKLRLELTTGPLSLTMQTILLLTGLTGTTSLEVPRSLMLTFLRLDALKFRVSTLLPLMMTTAAGARRTQLLAAPLWRSWRQTLSASGQLRDLVTLPTALILKSKASLALNTALDLHTILTLPSLTMSQ